MAAEPSASTWSRQVRSGLLDLAILLHLQGGDVHGYALISSLKREGLMAADGGEATVYQALQRLANAGLATSAWLAEGDERPRKMYAITRRGRTAAAQMAKEWHAARRSIDKLLEETA